MSNQPKRRMSKRLASRRMDGDDAHWRQRADRNPAAAGYERDDDFQFVRKSQKAKSKTGEPGPVKGRGRTAANQCAINDPATNGSIVEEPPTTDIEVATKPATRKPSRRKPSVDASIEEPPLKISKRQPRRSARVSEERKEEVQQTTGASRKRRRRAKSPPPDWDRSPEPRHEASVESAKIALPMSDTPVINRNKEMRKQGTGNRRSSLGMRGRRASSLIESGQTAIPHKGVNPADFYKHIEAEGLTEPRRMKQLLTWCGERALAGKPSHGRPNSNAILGARAIQDQLLKDFASRSEFSDWFSRDGDVSKAGVVPKPNPRNIELDEKLAQLEINIKRLQEEKKAWRAIRKPRPEQPSLFSEDETGPIVLPDSDLLDPEERKIRGFLADEAASFDAVRSQTESRLRIIQSSLEFQIDQLSDNVHKLEQRVLVAGKETDKALSASAIRLCQREEREKASMGTRDMPLMEVLRSLGNILLEGGG